MKQMIILLTGISVGVSFISPCVAQTPDGPRLWRTGTAYLLPHGAWEIGVFEPARYGFRDYLEVEAHPLLFFVIPNFGIKWDHGYVGDLKIASRHTLLYPSILLNLLARKGTGGIISPEFHIPPMVEFYHEFLASAPIVGSTLLTGKVGVSLAKRMGAIDERSTIDLPLVYPRLAVFYHGFGLRGGIDLEGNLISHLRFLVDADLFFIPGVEFGRALESKALLYWHAGGSTRLCLGAKVTYGEYPFGNQWHLLLPLVDLQFSWR